MRSFRFLLLSALIPVAAFAQEDMHSGEPDPLFSSHDVVQIKLTGPFNKISRDKDEEPQLRPGSLSMTGEDGQEQTFAVQLEPRGKSRRDRAVCTFPPLWVHFDSEEVKGTLFKKQKKLKAVTHCRSPNNYQDYVILEYLVYRIFNVLNPPVSFNVRLLEVSYDESTNDKKPLVRYGFFIEHKKRVAKRLNTEILEPADRIHTSTLHPEQTALAELFQFMVSNTDFSFIAPPVDDTCCHNGVLFDAGDGLVYPVPYDFDRTGLVSPPNGLPDANLGQRSFRDRVFRGFCHDPAVMDAAMARTVEARAEIEALIANQPGLSSKGSKNALKFIGSYYDILENEKRRAKDLKCRSVN
jgi:hypothetical protein